MKKTLIGLFAFAAFLGAQADNSSPFILENGVTALKKCAVHSYKPAATRADESEGLVFSYCQDFYMGLGVQQPGSILEGAIQIPREQAIQWQGNKITKILIGFGNSSNRDITVYLTRTPTGNAFYTQEATISTINGWNEIVLDTPYTIEDYGFLIGYQSVSKTSGDYPIGCDGVLTSNQYADWVGVDNEFDHIGSMFGSVCLKAVITGDNLPQYDVAASSLNISPFVEKDKAFEVSFNINNNGVKTINDLEVSVSINNEVVSGYTLTMEPASLSSGSIANVTISNLKCNASGMNIPISVTVTKVNGQEDETPENNVVSSTFNCGDESYPQNVVIEEFTSIGCGWCVRGIVGMDYMLETYGNKGFIGLAGHTDYGSTRDPMLAKTYLPVVNAFASQFPMSVINRAYAVDPSKEDLEEYYLILSQLLSPVNVSLEAAYNPETEMVDVTSTIQTSITMKGSYSLAFAVTENNVGPYMQLNYYAGGSYGDMDGWGSQPSRVSTMFNQVVREINSAFGIDGSVPNTLEPGQKYTYTTTLSTENITDLNNCEFSVLLLDNSTDEVINAGKAYLGISGVKGIMTSGQLAVIPSKGAINIAGEYMQANVYSIDGKNVASVNGATSINVAPGLYVVKVIGADNKVTSKKVLVK